MDRRRWELVTTNESTFVTESLLDAIVVKNSQGDGSLAYTTGTNESNRCQVLSETDDLLDQVIASEANSWWWWRRFSGDTRRKCKRMNPSITQIADLV